MSTNNYQEFVKRAKEGDAPIRVEPAGARKFFTDTTHSTIKDKVGESLLVERLFVKTCWLLGYACLIATMIASIFALKWYSIIAKPVILVGFTLLSGEAYMGKQRILDTVFLMVICVSLAYYFRDKGTSMFLWLVLLPLPYFFIRLTYKLSTMFLRSLSIRNEKAFNLFNSWLPDINKSRTVTSARDRYRRGYMGQMTPQHCQSCEWYNTAHCPERAQLYAWRGEGSCFTPRRFPRFQARTLI